MSNVVVHGVVAVVGIGVDETLVAGEERLREVLTPTGGEVEEGCTGWRRRRGRPYPSGEVTPSRPVVIRGGVIDLEREC